MIDILNLALPYFGLIFIGYACGKYKRLPEAGLEWMNFFLLYVSLPALFFRTLARTPLEELNNPPFVIATTLATASAFFLSMFGTKLFAKLSMRESAMAGLGGGYGNIGYMGPGLALATLGAKANAPVALIFCFDTIFLFTTVPLLMVLTDGERRPLLPTLTLVARQILLHPLIVASYFGVAVAAFHVPVPVGLDNMFQFLQSAAAPVALFALGLSLRKYGIARNVKAGTALALVKLFLMPALALVMAWLFGLPPLTAKVAVAAASLPAGVNSYLIATQFGTGQALASNAMTIGTAMAVASTAFWLAVAQMVFG